MVDAAFQKAVPLLDYAKSFDEGTLERAFIDTFAETSDLAAVWPLMNVKGGKHKYTRTAELPDVKFRGYNEPGNTSHGKVTKFEEGVYLMDEYVKVDRALVDELGPQERAQQEHLKAVSLAQEFSRVLIKGDNRADPREPSGMQARATRLDVNLFHNSVASGGGPLSLLKLDQIINSVNGANYLVMDWSFRPFMQAAARNPTLTNSAILMNQTDPLGRKVMSYNGIPILWGYEPDDSDPLLPFNEVGIGGGAPATGSIYAVALRKGRMFGIEGTPLTVRDEGQIQGVPVLSTHMKWDWGIVEEHPRSQARLTSITKAAVVA